MKNNSNELKIARLKHATTTVVAGILFILSIVRERYILAVGCFVLFVIGVSLYKSIGDEKR